MAVAAPAHRAPITIASYIGCRLCDPNRPWRAVSPAEVQRIAAIGSPVLRNLEITYAYSLLAAEVAARTGQGANWCTFATWASRQAGATIRGEDALDLADGPARRRLAAAPAVVVRALAAAARALRLARRGSAGSSAGCTRRSTRSSWPRDAVARGNRKVFEEIGYEFARWLEADDLDAFLAGLRDGDPPDGQRLPAGRVHALLARRRPAPQAAAAAPTSRSACTSRRGCSRRSARRSTRPTSPTEELGRRLCPGRRPRVQRAAGARSPAPVQGKLAELSRELITHSLMVLSVPGRILLLGADLDDPYPEVLRALTDAELAALIGELRAHGRRRPLRRDDWSNLDQRMHYIVHLFRVFHEQRDLFDAPFTPAQVEQLPRGRDPGRRPLRGPSRTGPRRGVLGCAARRIRDASVKTQQDLAGWVLHETVFSQMLAVMAPLVVPLLRLASDQRLAELVAAGSAHAFEVLYDRHSRPVLGFCRHMLGSIDEAEDVLQHTFVAAYRDLRRSGPPAAVRPWLFVIARNRCISVLRARREVPAATVPERGIDRLAADVATREELRAVLAGRRPPAGRPARRARAVRARRCHPRRDRPHPRLPARAGEGVRLPGPLGADRRPRGPRHPVRRHPRAARGLSRRAAAADGRCAGTSTAAPAVASSASRCAHSAARCARCCRSCPPSGSSATVLAPTRPVQSSRSASSRRTASMSSKVRPRPSQRSPNVAGMQRAPRPP